MAEADYLQILDWLARNRVAGKRGSTPVEAPAIFERLGIRETWGHDTFICAVSISRPSI